MQLTEKVVSEWADKTEVADLTLAELDYRLTSALESIYILNGMTTELVMKGGTAINKLYLRDTSRLSIDLDFNQVGNRNRGLSRRSILRKTLIETLRTLDSNYQLSFKRNWNQTTIRARYLSLTRANQQLKLEISHVERIPILDLAALDANSPIGNFKISTYSPEELLATKLRALFENHPVLFRASSCIWLYHLRSTMPSEGSSSDELRDLRLWYGMAYGLFQTDILLSKWKTRKALALIAR